MRRINTEHSRMGGVLGSNEFNFLSFKNMAKKHLYSDIAKLAWKGPPKNLYSCKQWKHWQKTVSLNFSRILEINQSLAAIWGAFIHEKPPNLIRNSKRYGIFICPIPIPAPLGSLESQEPAILVRTGSLAATRGRRMGLQLLQDPISRGLLLYGWSGGSLEDPTQKDVFI